MPEEPEPTEPAPPEVPKPPDPADLPEWARDAITKANTEAAKYRTKVKELEPLAQKAKELEDQGKGEVEKLTERTTAAEARAEQAEHRLLVAEIASEKGLTAALAKRLVGATREELEADADELLASVTPEDTERPPGRPKERLRPGAMPNAEPDPDDAAIEAAVAKVRRF